VQPTDEEMAGSLKKQQPACPNCGFTLAQFRKEGVLGCPYDYEIFERSLIPLIEKAHDGKTAHCGKIPSKTPHDTKKHMTILNLRQQLEAAVKNEDYELAAKLRDEINSSEK
jgi:protein arginine kinase activator